MISALLRGFGNLAPRLASAATLAAMLMANAPPPLRAAAISFTGEYDLANFTLVNSEFANGFAVTGPGGLPLVLTGPNDGSGLPGATDLFIAAPAPGLVQFSYEYSTLDPDPGFDYAGYLLDGSFYALADTDGQSGDVAFFVNLGTMFGFRVGTLDNIGEPGVITVTQFSAPESAAAIPEPGTLTLLAFGLVALIASRRLAGGSRRMVFMLAVGLAAGAGIPQALAQSSYAGTNITGQIVLTRVVNLRQAALRLQALGSLAISKETRPRTPPRVLRPNISTILSPLSGLNGAPPMIGLTVVASTGGFGLNALSHRDQRLANQGNQFSIEPPSPSLAVGNGYILEGVNNAIQVYTANGLPVLPAVLASNQVFGLAPAIDWNTGINGPYLTDMRVFFDSDINRWFVIQRTQDNDVLGTPLNTSHLYLAVSASADPTGDYYIYVMDTTNASNPGCPCVADYPQIGSDQYGFHIAVNEFDTATNTRFVDAAILSISKAALSSGAAQPAAYRYLLRMDTGYEFALQPATTPPGARHFLTNGGVAYFASTSAGAIADRLAVWALTNTSSLATPNPAPALASVRVPILPYVVPDIATQKPGPAPYGASFVPPAPGVPWLDGGDSRVQSVSYSGGRLYVTFATSVTDQRGSRRVGGAYVVLSPVLRSTFSAAVLNQGYLLVDGNHVLRPALAVNAAGKGFIVVTLVGPDWYPSAAYIPVDAFNRPSTVFVAAPGELPEDGFTGYSDWGALQVARWGDYNSAVATPDGAVWMVAEYIGNYPRTEYANWNTFVFRVQP